MRRGLPTAVIAFMGLLCAVSAAAQTPAAEQALITQYCVGCHSQRAKVGGLVLEGLDAARPGEHQDVWEKVIRKLRAGLMPPAGARRPDASARDALVRHLETELDRAAAARPAPGRTAAFHRLNRSEYSNAIRDALAIDIDVTQLLPADDASFGFDNIGGVLKLSEASLEQYLSVARKVSRAAVSSPLITPIPQEFRVPDTLNQYEHIDGLPFGTRGGLLAPYSFPHDGEYEIVVDLLCRIGGECDGSAGFPDEHRLEVLLDGEVIKEFTLEPRREFRAPAERTWRVRLPVKAGPHAVAATFPKLPSVREADSVFERFQRPYYLDGIISRPHQTIYQPFVDRITIAGPLNVAGVTETPSRRRIFTCHPGAGRDAAACAKTILAALARRLYRRPVTDADIAPLMQFYRQRSADGFEAGVEAGLRRLLVSPEFLFRVERDPANVPAGGSYRIAGLELASRLSFFLWSSIPDDELIALGASGRLFEPAILEGQVRRMIANPRSKALVENFAGQWLMLRNLRAVRPDQPLFPNFDDTLRLAFLEETELFVESVLREDRGVMELLTADYTFVNERLARHYGIPNVYGTRFRRVAVPDENRRGLLGHGSILTVTSRPNRTSPVLRGKWILDNVMGTPPPDPPADVPALQEKGNDNSVKTETVRERLAQHRKNPACAGCHAMLDPPGFALENFDAVGRWRALDDNFAVVDASGTLPDGTKFDGLVSFKKTLVSDPVRFATTVTAKLMTYALGRGLESYDMPAIRHVVREAASGGYTLSSLLLGIVRSTPFQMRAAER
jgi:mono/diheme cytochrome c family protein